MRSPDFYQKILLKIHRSFWLFPFSFLLKGASFLFAQGAKIRIRRYHQPGVAYRPRYPVISVGNLSVGGTGKTPFVAYLLRMLNPRPLVVLSRGYGGKEGGKNDEALLLEREFPDLKCRVSPNRVQQSQCAEREDHLEGFILEDGFQHRALCRDFDIVLWDALLPLDLAYPLPAGFLREGLSALERADFIILSHADKVNPRVLEKLESFLRPYTSAPFAYGAHHLRGWKNREGIFFPLHELPASEVFAFCGIGNPYGFLETLKAIPLAYQGFRFFPDHYAYRVEDIQALEKLAKGLPLVTTGKDVIKIQNDWLSPQQECFEAVLEFQIFREESLLQEQILKLF